LSPVNRRLKPTVIDLPLHASRFTFHFFLFTHHSSLSMPEAIDHPVFAVDVLPECDFAITVVAQ
jgi:hypothetical protein